jgi:hypothetical protein
MLADKEGKNALTKSRFGQLWLALVQKQPFVNAMFFNGGMLGALPLVSSRTLRQEHVLCVCVHFFATEACSACCFMTAPKVCVLAPLFDGNMLGALPPLVACSCMPCSCDLRHRE